MTYKKKKEKRIIPLRDAGEVIQIKAEDRPSMRLFGDALAAEKVLNEALPTTTNHPLPPPTTKTDISPKRDYTKVANSIARDAVPSGLFKGTSKATYDVLYLRTRGAINPTRTIKAVQSDVLLWTNISHNTLRAHLKHLQSVGLIKVHYKLGDNNGAEYEVLIPEEIDLTSYYLLPPPTTSQNLVGGTYQKPLVGGGRFDSENIDSNDALRLFFKTLSFKIDDEKGIVEFLELLNNSAKQKTGKNLTAKDWLALIDIAKLLIAETDIAASRTNSISSYIPFMAENLRRRLRATPKVQNSKDVVKTVNMEPEPLDEESRLSLLESYQKFLDEYGMNWVDSNQNQFTKEDWKWLKENLVSH